MDHTLFSLIAHWIWSQIMEKCLIKPEKPGIPAFWWVVSMYLFGMKTLAILLPEYRTLPLHSIW